jgi:RNA polymerase sigma factor (sigma-70 family)
MVNEKELIPHLFRTEYRNITTVLCKLFGIEHIEVAEDIASETFLSALENWPYKGIPENPIAWLYSVAKNKTRNYLNRNQIFANKIVTELKHSTSEEKEPEIDLSEKNITDTQLQMLFALCHPKISAAAQIGLSLRVLCGFGIEEIANAFLVNKETINKRLFRAKEKLRIEKVAIEFPSEHEIDNRLDAVLTTLYLVFNEGYYSESQDDILREDLCFEAIRMTELLIENEKTNTPNVNALLALMYFHSSRFEARKGKNGQIILYDEQNEKFWNRELISKGANFLKQSSQGTKFSKYHIEASIAYWHTQKADTNEKWENILQLYNLLLQLEYSPIAALNRTFAFSKIHGKKAAILEAEKLNLSNNHYFFTLLGELYNDNDVKKSIYYFGKALSIAKTKTDKQTIQLKIDGLSQSNKQTEQ